jgi:hypothetical protein
MEPEPEMPADPDTVEMLRWVFKTNKRYSLTHAEIETLFRAFDEREKSRMAAVKMGIAMAGYMKDRDDFQGKLARQFLEMFLKEVLPPEPSPLDRLLAEGSQPEEKVN